MDNRIKSKTEEDLDREIESLNDDASEEDTKSADNEEDESVDDLEEEAQTNKNDEEDESLKDDDEEEEEIEEKKPQPKPQIPENQPPDVEKRLRESTREAQLLHERNNQLVSAFEEAEKITDPTDEELKKYVQGQGAEWEELSVFEKSMAKNSYINSQKLSRVNKAVSAIKDIDGWAVKVDEFLDTNERKQSFKPLIGKEARFREFAMNKSHRGIPLEILLSHFLRTSPEDKQTRGEMFIKQGGGEKVQRKNPNKITETEDAERLRKSDPREYARRLKAGLIDLDVD